MTVEIRSSIANINRRAESPQNSWRCPTLRPTACRPTPHRRGPGARRAAIARGRNPNEHGKKSASKIGSITVFVAAWTIRSRTAGIDNGLRSLLPGFGMNTRRAASGR